MRLAFKYLFNQSRDAIGFNKKNNQSQQPMRIWKIEK